MRDQDDGDVVAEVVHRFHHRLFGEVIQRAGGFIQNKHLRVMVKRTGNTDALALPARETHTALAHGGGVALRQVIAHKLMQIGDFGGTLNGLLVDAFGFYTKGNVGGHAVIGQINLLRYITNSALPLAAVGGGDGLAVNF